MKPLYTLTSQGQNSNLEEVFMTITNKGRFNNNGLYKGTGGSFTGSFNNTTTGIFAPGN